MDNDKKMDDAKPIEPVRQKSATKDPTKAAHDVEKTTKAPHDVEKTTKATNDGEKATKKLLTIKSPIAGVSFPMGRPSEHGPKEVDIRRKSSWGSFSRVVLCAIDASPCARYAFEWYLNNVWQKDDLIVLVHIPESPSLPPLSFKAGIHPPVEEWKKSLDKMNSKMRQLEEEFEGECIKRKLKYKIRGESFKSPGEGICVIAEDEQADLIVIGSRGAGAVKRAFIGSVSDFVIRHAGIPCLVVRAKKLQ